MGLLIGASGTGKTSAVNDWLFERWWATGFSVGITTKTCGAVLQKICRILNIHTSQTISEAFDRVISRLKGSKRMLIFDESHFLSWEALELLRQIHDSAGISIVLSGQPILYSQMKGTRKGYLFDQLYSRIGMKCYLIVPEKVDLRNRGNCFCEKVAVHFSIPTKFEPINYKQKESS
jgi:Uncharacterized ATPase, putative transposase